MPNRIRCHRMSMSGWWPISRALAPTYIARCRHSWYVCANVLEISLPRCCQPSIPASLRAMSSAGSGSGAGMGSSPVSSGAHGREDVTEPASRGLPLPWPHRYPQCEQFAPHTRGAGITSHLCHVLCNGYGLVGPARRGECGGVAGAVDTSVSPGRARHLGQDLLPQARSLPCKPEPPVAGRPLNLDVHRGTAACVTPWSLVVNTARDRGRIIEKTVHGTAATIAGHQRLAISIL